MVLKLSESMIWRFEVKRREFLGDRYYILFIFAEDGRRYTFEVGKRCPRKKLTRGFLETIQASSYYLIQRIPPHDPMVTEVEVLRLGYKLQINE